jgi:hypothetical protein
MAADETNDQQLDLDPALVEILQGGHDRATTGQLLRRYQQKRDERQMRRCQQGWEATRDPAFIVEAQALIDIYQRPPPPWLSEAIYDLATEIRAETKEYAARARQALVRRLRFEAVLAAKPGRTWPEAHAEAARVLADKPGCGGVDSMKAAYGEVAKDIREGRGDLYITPHPERGEILKRRG